jgi:hypothetical protein
MNEVPPDQGEADEVDDLYRRASSADTSRPSESVRRAVLEHAAQLAAQRSREAAPAKIDFTRRAANQPWRRPAIFGTLAAAALAGLMIAPQFFSPHVTDTSVSSNSETSLRQSAAGPAAKSPINALQAPANAPLRAEAPPAPFPAPPLQANERAAQMQSDKRRDFKADAPARVAGRVDASRQGTVADNARAETENLAKVLTTQANSVARTQSAANAPASAAASGAASSEATADAARTQDLTSRLGAITAGRVQAAPKALSPAPAAPAGPVAPAASAARAADPAVELRRAAEIGDLSALRAALDTQPAIDARDAGGRTALMLATLHGQSRAVEMLLASGADPNAPDVQGTTPLQAAMAANQPAIAEALRRAGAR